MYTIWWLRFTESNCEDKQPSQDMISLSYQPIHYQLLLSYWTNFKHLWLVFNYSVSFMKFKRFIGYNYVTFAIQTHCYARSNDVCAVGMCVQEGDHRNIIKGKE